jgi:hypothetical protein
VVAFVLGPSAWAAAGAAEPSHAGRAIAYDAAGEIYFVAYTGVDSTQDPFVTTFDAYGAPTGAGDFRIVSDVALQQHVAIARDETTGRFFLAYDQVGGQIQLRLMNADGTFEGSARQASSAGLGTTLARPALAVSGGNERVFVVWEDNRSVIRTDIYGRAFTTTGVPLTTEFRLSAADQEARSPDITFMTVADRFLSVYVEPATGDIGALQTTPYGVADGVPYTLHTGSAPANPAAACAPDSGEALVVWEESGDILGIRLDDTAAPSGSPFTICSAAGTQSLPDVCWEETNGYWLVAWQSDNGSDLDIEGCVVPSTGTPSGTTYAIASSSDDACTPSIHAAATGRGHAAVSYWNATSDTPAMALFGEPRVAVESSLLSLNERSMTTGVDVWLQTPPATPVTVNVTNPSPGDLSVTPASLTFTATDFLTPQAFVFDPIEDTIDEGYGEAFNVTLSVDPGSDAGYAALPDETILVNLWEWTEPGSACGTHGVAAITLLLAGHALLARRRKPAL